MRTLLALVSALLALAYQDDGFQSIFDGQTFSGWQRFGGKNDVWSIADDCLIHHGEGGGWLGTQRDLANFILRLEFRMDPGANSGIYLRAPADTSHISRTGMEIQILDDDHPRYRDLMPWQYTGSIYHVAPATRGHLKPAGQWNQLEIRADGPHVVVSLNGSTVVDDRIDRHPDLEAEHTGLSRKTGRIGLQSHNGHVEFRRIQIREL